MENYFFVTTTGSGNYLIDNVNNQQIMINQNAEMLLQNYEQIDNQEQILEQLQEINKTLKKIYR